MPKTLDSSQNYRRLRQVIARELAAGAERVRRSCQQEVVRTYWNVGKILRVDMGLEDKPSAKNARLIASLTKDLSRPESFFYDAAKFHRCYPKSLPRTLSWSHYALLIRLDDPAEREALKKRALDEGINARDLRMYTRLRPGQVPAIGNAGKLPLERGRLYHYRASTAPKDGRVRVDIGFGIERDVLCNDEGAFHSGLIVRAVKEGEDYSAKIAQFEKTLLYTYIAALDRVVDGDTLVARVDLGFRTWITQKFRLRGINTPEMTCALGQKAKAEVKARLEPCKFLAIKTYKQEKFGRFLSDIFYLKDSADPEGILAEGIFLNQELLDLGLAVLYDGQDQEQKDDI